MANVPAEIEITTEEFKKDDQDLVEKLAEPLIRFSQETSSALRGLTMANWNGELRNVSITGNGPASFKYDKGKPIGVSIVNWQNQTDSTATVTSAVSVDWKFDGKQTITLNHVAGLSASNRYLLTVTIING